MIIAGIFAILFVFYLLGRGGSRYQNGHYTGRPLRVSRRARQARAMRRGYGGERSLGRRVARSLLLRGIF